MLVYLVLGLNIAISLWAFMAFKSGKDYYRFLFVPAWAARGKNLEGAVLSQFSHADLGHLAFNMLTLFFFGPRVEQMLGAHFLTVYFVSGSLANLAVFILRRHNPDYKVLGASGAVTGVLFTAIVLDPYQSVALMILPIPIPAPLFAIAYLLLSTFWMSRGDMANISHEAHIGGAVSGLALGGLLAPYGFGPLIESVQQLLHR